MHSLVFLSESAAGVVPQDRKRLAGEDAGRSGGLKAHFLLQNDVLFAVLSEQRGDSFDFEDGEAFAGVVYQRTQRYWLADADAHRCELYGLRVLR